MFPNPACQRQSTPATVKRDYAVTAVSWGTLAVLQMPATESVPAVVLYLLGGFSTLIVAFFVVFRRPKNERQFYLSRFFRFRLSPAWYVLSIVAATLVVMASYGVIRALFPAEAAQLPIKPLYLVIPFFFMMVFGGGIEEFGWRGIVVQNLRTMNPVAISVIVGVIWFVWHVPLFFILGVAQYQTSMISFFIGLMGYSFVTTALYLKTESVVPCLIFHALINAFAEIGFWAAADPRLSYWDSSVRLVVGLVFFAVIMYSRKPGAASVAGRSG